MEFKVTITMAVGLSEEPAYHEYTLEGESENEVFLSIVKSEWFIGKRFTKFHNRPDLDRTYHDFIQTKHIADICIWEEKKQ